MQPFNFSWRRDKAGYLIKDGMIRRRGNHPSDMVAVDFAPLTVPVQLLFAGLETPGYRGGNHFIRGHPYNCAYDEALDGPVDYAFDEGGEPHVIGDVSPMLGNGVLRFVNYFGLLGDATGGDDAASMSLSYFLDQRMRVRAMLEYGRFHVFEPYIPDPRARERAEVLEKRRPLSSKQATAFNEHVQPHMSIRLGDSHHKGLYQIEVIPLSLISYIWLGLAQIVAYGMESRRCENARCPDQEIVTVKVTSKWVTCGDACRKHIQRHPEDDRRNQSRKKGK